MFSVGFHEYVRIVVPAVLFVGFLSLFVPVIGDLDSNKLLLLAASLGLMVTPFFDWLAKKWFHRQVTGVGFYEELVRSFLAVHGIQAHEHAGPHLRSFSGSLAITDSPEGRAVLEAYKAFARRGWSGEADSYRIRTEKSIGMLYFSMACYLAAALLLYGAGGLFAGFPATLGNLPPALEMTIIAVPLLICVVESRRRFRASLQNEHIVIEAHMGDLKALYDDIFRLICAESGSGRSEGVAPVIRHVVFDMGGVVQVLLDDQLKACLLQRTGVTPERLDWYFEVHVPSVQIGTLSEEQFLRSLLDDPQAPLPPDAADWFTEPFEQGPYMHDDVVAILDQVKERGAGLAVLSNTIPSHAAFNRSRGHYAVFGDNVFLSCEIGAVKPGRDAFEQVLRSLDCRPGEVLYIDDMQVHVDAARALGIAAEVHDSDRMPSEHLLGILRQHGVLD